MTMTMTMIVTTATTLAIKRVLQQPQTRASTGALISRCNNNNNNNNTLQKQLSVSSSSSLSFSTQPDKDPSLYVQGVTADDLENNPALQEYFAANFPEEFGKEQGADDDEDVFEIDGIMMKIGSPPQGAKKEEQKRGGKGAGGAGASAGAHVDITAQQCDLSLNIRPMVSYKRDLETEEGSRKCQVLRDTSNMIPGIIYGSDPTKGIFSRDSSSRTLIKTPNRFIQREMDLFTYHNFGSRVYDLTLFEDEDDTEGTVHRVMPRDVQHHPIQHSKLYCCNYLRYFPGKPIDIPIVYINEEESPAIKRGGFIAPFNRYVPCIVEDGVKIPEAIELDCTGTLLKDVLRRDRLIFPDGVTPSHKAKESFLIGTVFGRRVDQVAAVDEEQST